MSVLVEAISVLVRRVTLEAKYPGGVARYREDCPSQTFCMDDRLTRIGFMAPADVRDFIDRLKGFGLTFYNGEQFCDIAVVDQMDGPTAACPWLQWTRHEEGYCVAWRSDGTPESLAHPPGWTPGQSGRLHLTRTEDIERELLPMRAQTVKRAAEVKKKEDAGNSEN